MMQAAIFDLDGTLLDSMPFWQDLVVSLVQDFDIGDPAALARELESMTLVESADLIASRYTHFGSPDEIMSCWRTAIEQAYYQDLQLKPAAAAYLAHLATNGVKIGLATLTDRDLVEPALRRLGIYPFFQSILTVADVGVSKQNPAIWLSAARELQTPVSQCTVFEDSLYAARTAKSAGFTVYAIADPTTRHHASALQEICDGYFFDYHELIHAFGNDSGQP